MSRNPRLSYQLPEKALECPHCGTVHSVTLEPSEEGLVAELETEPCHDDECTERLCSECVGKCFCCDLTFCSEHLSDYDGNKWCRSCRSESEEQELAEVA